ncbi:hypothetical protein BDF20DRAFT_793997, partial [Mycotypha africana]|uniref:uncharacterized protein n=1 Tax=Mycotypha africana TaxID=64632 RepID=UPI0023008825
RNDPPVIRARIKAVTVASIISALIVWYFNTTQYNVWTLLGVLPQQPVLHLLSVVSRPLLLTGLLFLGPISMMFFEEELPFQKHFVFRRDIVDIFTSLQGQRNYVVGPLTEEFVFRACVIAILFQAHYSKKYLIFASPLYFGLAHLHHTWENYNAFGRNSRALKRAIFVSLFQFTYTTIFGWYASFLFIRTNHVLPPILCHSFCNIMGVPDI